MVPFFAVSICAFFTALGLFRESKKKTSAYYRARWAFMSLPFLYCGILYGIQLFVNIPLELFSPLARAGLFSIVLTASIFFLIDLCDEILERWRNRND